MIRYALRYRSRPAAAAAKAVLLAGVATFALAGAAHATIAFFLGNVPEPSEQNVMFESGSTSPALSQTGDTNRSNSPVIFDTSFTAGPGSLGGNGTNQLIEADGIGQANIECDPSGLTCVNNGHGLTNQLNSLEMRPGTGFGWKDAILNPDSGTGTMNVYVQDNLGNNFDKVLKKGENFVTIIATKGEVITDIQLTGLTSTFGWDKLKQPRVSGVCALTDGTCTPLLVPEPATVAVLGIGLLGLGIARRRRVR